MTTTSYNIYQQITSVRLASPINLVGTYFNGSLNNGVGATLTAQSVGILSVDGINVEIGDRIFLIQQSSSNQNGIYVVQAKGGPTSLWILERSSDFQSLEQLKIGQYFTVGAGNTLSGDIYVLIEPLPTSIGLGSFNFAIIPSVGGGGGGTVTQIDTGTGLTGGPITSSGTISLAPIPDQDFLANTSGSSAPPIPTPLSTLLLKANNLSDLKDNAQGFTNLGLGSGADLIIDEADFVLGLYTLTNPCPNIIFVNSETPGNAIKLPSANSLPDSFIPSQGPVFILQEGFEPVEIQDFSGAPIVTLNAPGCEQFILTDNSTSDGVWYVRSFVSTVNGLSGDVIIDGSGNDLQTTYDTGDNAEINLSKNRPLSIRTVTSSSGVEAVASPSTGSNTIANYRVLGFTFSRLTNFTVLALQYDDSLFTQPGTRQTGIYVKATQELLVVVNIAKTDPLVSGYRTHTLPTPLILTGGVEYVYATVMAANETNHINGDAVPSLGLTIPDNWAGPASTFPLSLQFPTNFDATDNLVPVGSLVYDTFAVNEEVNFNDSTSDPNTIVEVKSTARATIFEPPMTLAQMNAMGTTNIGSAVFITDVSERRPYRFTGLAWQALAYAIDIPFVPALTQGQIIIGVTASDPVAGDITSPNSTLTKDVATNGQIKLDVARPMPALQNGELAVGVGGTGNVQQRGNLTSTDGTVQINTSGAPNINLAAVQNMQQVYDNGSDIILIPGVDITVKNSVGSILKIEDGGSGFDSILSIDATTQSTIPYAVVSDSSFSSFAATVGLIAFGTTSGRLLTRGSMAINKVAYTTDFLSGTFTPSISNVTGTSAISFVKGMYSTSGFATGNIITCSLQFTCSVSVLTVATVKIASLPVPPNTFTNANQAMTAGGFIYTNTTPTIADGAILDTTANTSANDVNFSFLVASTLGTKVITVTFSYVVQ